MSEENKSAYQDLINAMLGADKDSAFLIDTLPSGPTAIDSEIDIPDDIMDQIAFGDDSAQYDRCWETGYYTDQICEFCHHNFECSGYHEPN